MWCLYFLIFEKITLLFNLLDYNKFHKDTVNMNDNIRGVGRMRLLFVYQSLYNQSNNTI